MVRLCSAYCNRHSTFEIESQRKPRFTHCINRHGSAEDDSPAIRLEIEVLEKSSRSSWRLTPGRFAATTIPLVKKPLQKEFHKLVTLESHPLSRYGLHTILEQQQLLIKMIDGWT